MEWIAALIRAVGSSFPGAASLVQLNSEIAAACVNKRLARLEDPISALHPNVQEFSSAIYQALKAGAGPHLEFEEAFYQRFGRPMAALVTHGAINTTRVLGKSYPVHISIRSPSYVLYMAALFESKTSMSKLVKAVDECKPRERLDGTVLATQLQLPVPVVRAVLELYHKKGYGMLSNDAGSNVYVAKV